MIEYPYFVILLAHPINFLKVTIIFFITLSNSAIFLSC